MGETWKPIPGYEGLYEASDLGRVRSIDRVVTRSDGRKCMWRGRIRKQRPNKFGHMSVDLSKCGVLRTFNTHRLVVSAFIGAIPQGMDVCHNDGNPANNRLSNLRVDTRAGNVADMEKHGTKLRGENVSGAKLTEQDVRDIRAKYKPRQVADLANEYDIRPSYVWAIVKRKRWAHVD